MEKNLGTVVAYGKNDERVELAITSYLRATYKDHRLISMAQLEDDTYVLSIENPESTGRATSQRMRLTPESLIGLLSTFMLYFDTMGVNLEDMLKEAVRESGNIDFSFDRIENYEESNSSGPQENPGEENEITLNSSELHSAKAEGVCCIDEKECFYPICHCPKRSNVPIEKNKKHTPTPWAVKKTDGWPPEKHIISSTGSIIATLNWDTLREDITPPIDEVNAEFIVTACNAYNTLKQDNEELRIQLAKSNSDKEQLGELLKEVLIEYSVQQKHTQYELIKKQYFQAQQKILQALKDCGIKF